MLEATRPRPIIIPEPSGARDLDLCNVPSPTRESPGGQLRSFLLTVLVVTALSAVLVVILLHFRESMARLGSWGYVVGFIAELSNSAMIIVPTPAPAYTFAMGITLNPLLLGLAGGAGAAIGELGGYLLGARGRGLVNDGQLYKRIIAMTERRMGPLLLALAMLPLPFDVAGAWAGVVRYPIRRFLVIVMVGKVVKVTAIAFAGYFSIGWLMGSID